MIIRRLEAKNFRTLSQVQIDFTETYTALCGRNDAGKSNIIRAVRLLLVPMRGSVPYAWRQMLSISMERDFPKWMADSTGAEKRIDVTGEFEVFRDRDSGLFNALSKHANLPDDATRKSIIFRHSLSATEDGKQERTAWVNGTELTGVNQDEAIQRFRSAGIAMFHFAQMGPHLEPHGHLRFDLDDILPDGSGDLAKQLAKPIASINRKLKRYLKTKESEISTLLGKLQTKYQVAISSEDFSFEGISFDLTLGNRTGDIPLSNWGSGTQNRTQILLALLKARAISSSDDSPEKATPIILIEEPESFLHPSAQGEFARILRDISSEFGIQIIVTTHCPYMLNMEVPRANLLVRRVRRRSVEHESEVLPSTGDAWVKPFADALGVDEQELSQWKDIFLSANERGILCEGPSDKRVFEELLEYMKSKGDTIKVGISDYGGVGFFENEIVFRFVNQKYSQVLYTFDLDREAPVTKKLAKQGLAKDRDWLAVGKDEAGKRCLEGLYPDSVWRTVLEAQPGLLHACASDDRGERDEGKARFKQAMLQEFLKVCKADPKSAFVGFGYVIKKIREVFKSATS